MPLDFLVEAPIGLLPVLVFLLVLQHMDAHKLVERQTVLLTLLAGGVLAAAAYFVNTWAIALLDLDYALYSRYFAPVFEECLKASVLIVLFWRNRVGFMVDAAIVGFAVGAGFALVENLYYLYAFPGANLGVWIVRGFGTAIMHGGATAVFGVLAQSLTERHTKFHPALYVPGLIVAVVLHSIFNHFPGYPLVATGATLIAFPLTLLFVFAKSEHAVHEWLISDYESHEHLLTAIRSGDFAHTEAGHFILDLAGKFGEETVNDMLTYLRLHTELVLRAEEVLLARERGEEVSLGAGERAAFARMHELEKKVGRISLLALWPHLHVSRQELWELRELENHGKHAHHHYGAHKITARYHLYARRVRRMARPTIAEVRKLAFALRKWLHGRLETRRLHRK